jgi:glycosyltransferase involved in cell wall biosynthesis
LIYCLRGTGCDRGVYLNILFVSDVSIAHVIGGAERVLYEQSARLARKGHHVHVLTRRLPEHASGHETIDGVHEWRYETDRQNALSFLNSTVSNGRILFEDLQLKHSFDCINFHQPFSAYGVIQSPMSRSIRKVYTCHSLSFEEYQSRNPRPQSITEKASFQANIQGRKRIEKKALGASKIIITLSAFTKDRLCNTYGISSDKIVVIPGGVDLAGFYPTASRMRIRKRLDIPTDHMILLSVRNLIPRMGLENLIHAMKDVVSRVENVTLLLGGSGPLKEELIALTQKLGLENHIHFAGFIPEDDLPDYYRASDIFILPTLELEGFGLVTLEALASGLPVLGTPVGGTLEILNKLDPRYLFRSSRSEDLSDLIIETCLRFKENPQLWERTSAHCRRFVEQNYSWGQNVDDLESILLGNFQ